MHTNHDWTYYQFDRSLGRRPVSFFRRWRGVTDALDQQAMAWVPVDPSYLSRYIENGEVGLDEITRAEIEAAIGSSLPA